MEKSATPGIGGFDYGFIEQGERNPGTFEATVYLTESP